MPMTCSAYRCNNHFYKGCGKQFFRFPVKDPERLSEWVTAIKRKNWKPSDSSRICSDHFTDKDYMLRPGATVPRLRLDAVPSVFVRPNKCLKERIRRKKAMETKQAPTLDTFDVKKTPVDDQNEDNPKTKVLITCSVPNCNNHTFKEKGKPFFRFPTEDPERLSAWVAAVQLDNWKPSDSIHICNDHFTDEDYVPRPGGMVPQLRVDAVPSVFNKSSERLEEQTASENEIKKLCMSPAAASNVTESRTNQSALREESTPCTQCDDSPATHIPSTSMTRVHCGTDMQEKEQIEESNTQMSHLRKKQPLHICAVRGCRNNTITGRDIHFFRFPIRNPEQLSKWLTAIQLKNWTPSAKSRICSDHFTSNDYRHRPGSLIPQLQACAVPSVFKVIKRMTWKAVKEKTNDEAVSCAVTVLLDEKPQTGIVDHTYYAVKTIANKSSPCTGHSTVNLRRRVKTLQRQIQRQRHTLKKLCEIITELKKNKFDHDAGSRSLDIQRKKVLL